MTFTGKIPKKLLFLTTELNRGKKNKEDIVSLWRDLKDDNKSQISLEKFSGPRKRVFDVYSCNMPKRKLDFYIKNPKFFVYDNEPTELKLIGYKNTGNKAQPKFEMEVLINTGHAVTIPPEVLLECAITDGIKPGGFMNGKFIFASINKKIKLIKVDSVLNSAIENSLKNVKKPLSIRSLTVGKVYKNKIGKISLFLGYVNTETMIVDIAGNSMFYYKDFDAKSEVEDFGVRFIRKNLITLWYEIRDLELVKDSNTAAENSKNILKKLNYSISSEQLYRFSCNKSYSFLEELPDYYVDTPDNMIFSIRKIAERKANTIIEQNRHNRTNPTVNIFYNPTFVAKGINNTTKAPPDQIRHYDANLASPYSSLANMTLFGMGVIRADVCRQFDKWETKTNKFKAKK